MLPSDVSTSIEGTLGGISMSKKRHKAQAIPITNNGHQIAIARDEETRVLELKLGIRTEISVGMRSRGK